MTSVYVAVNWSILRTASDNELDHNEYIGRSEMAMWIRLELDLYRTLLYRHAA